MSSLQCVIIQAVIARPVCKTRAARPSQTTPASDLRDDAHYSLNGSLLFLFILAADGTELYTEAPSIKFMSYLK